MIRVRHRDKLYKRTERKREKKHAKHLKEWLEWWNVSFSGVLVREKDACEQTISVPL